MRVIVTGQLDQWVKFMAGQVAIQARQSLLTSRYFQHYLHYFPCLEEPN